MTCAPHPPSLSITSPGSRFTAPHTVHRTPQIDNCKSRIRTSVPSARPTTSLLLPRARARAHVHPRSHAPFSTPPANPPRPITFQIAHVGKRLRRSPRLKTPKLGPGLDHVVDHGTLWLQGWGGRSDGARVMASGADEWGRYVQRRVRRDAGHDSWK